MDVTLQIRKVCHNHSCALSPMILSQKILVLIFLLSLLVSLSAGDFQPESMAYVLQTENLGTRENAIAKLAQSGRDLIVLDYAYDGSEIGKWTKAEIARIRAGKKGRKVVAYISIGEAEDYRSYWKKDWDKNKDGVPDKGAPKFLNKANPDWEGNYKVGYWDKDWQQIILKYIDEIIAQGFDGIYLDIIDAFEFYEHDRENDKWIDNRINPETDNTYRHDMLAWLAKIAEYTRKVKSGFFIIPQNGTQLADNKDFIKIISAIGVEDLFTEANKKQNQQHTKYVTGLLKKVKAAGKTVLVIEYGTKEKVIKIARLGAKKEGFVLLITDRELKTLGTAE